MWSTWSRNPNNCTAIARTGNYVVMTKPEKCQDMYKHSIDNVQSKWYTNIFLVDVVRNKPRYPKFPAFSIKNSMYTYQEFLNLGALSSFELSAKENLDATAQPLQDKVVSHCKLTHQILLAILNNIEEKKTTWIGHNWRHSHAQRAHLSHDLVGLNHPYLVYKHSRPANNQPLLLKIL